MSGEIRLSAESASFSPENSLHYPKGLPSRSKGHWGCFFFRVCRLVISDPCVNKSHDGGSAKQGYCGCQHSPVNPHKRSLFCKRLRCAMHAYIVRYIPCCTLFALPLTSTFSVTAHIFHTPATAMTSNVCETTRRSDPARKKKKSE